ncbi:tRNA pseudouridine synthase [Piedraia hortae CBS 480.64]|uniref:tRNA pseudouridine synthase n=1 Tax=Piedraia hortae CBS 480.64 TaxID=1314780 RepID=A0A6A7C6J7_9PEZI|nr:tRNA pseudouridine synthase [Piedraia hortae CBS 480.64]
MDDAATDGRKRKNYDSSKQSFGSRGHADSKKRKKGDLGRGEYLYVFPSPTPIKPTNSLSREGPDKRAKAEQSRLKRESDPAAPRYGIAFSQEEIAAEERRPKRKVAVLVGYAGTGYKGMQLTPTEKTIEGDLFEAFIKAGAISKANADDPKKASLVRCARTDKGVHAAGNVISLKLIVEDEGLVERVNGFLNGQIRVWGIVRTTNSFSAYQACDSRWYEYLIPTFAFLPPHPRSFLGRKVEEFAGEGYRDRQAEVETFWETVERERIAPLVEAIEEDIRSEVVKTLQGRGG